MRRLNEVWKKEEFIKAVKESFTIADVLRRLGKKVNSCGFYKVVHRDIKRFGLDTSHWLGRAHANRESNIRAAAIRSIPLSELLVKDCFHTPKGFKNRLLRANLLPYVCKLCGLNEWQGKSICLQLDHENGVNDDNRLENLRLLCPNCHSQTDTYCGRNNKVGRKPKKEADSNWRHKPKFEARIIERPSKEELEKLLWEKPMTHIGKQFGVSSNAIKKWAKWYGIEKPPTNYWAKIKKLHIPS